MKSGFLPKHKKLLKAWRELVLERHNGEFKKRITDTEIYRRAYPKQSEKSVCGNAAAKVAELKSLMEISDYQNLYNANIADFFERYDMNCAATKIMLNVEGKIAAVPDNHARNTATRDFSEFILKVAGPADQSQDNELTLTITDEAAE